MLEIVRNPNIDRFVRPPSPKPAAMKAWAIISVTICAIAHMREKCSEFFMKTVVATLSALAEPTRLAALAILWDGSEHCVCELMTKLGATESRMSRHIGVLKAAGLVTGRRDAQWMRYRRDRTLQPSIVAIIDAIVHALPQDGKKAA